MQNFARKLSTLILWMKYTLRLSAWGIQIHILHAYTTYRHMQYTQTGWHHQSLKSFGVIIACAMFYRTSHVWHEMVYLLLLPFIYHLFSGPFRFGNNKLRQFTGIELLFFSSHEKVIFSSILWILETFLPCMQGA